MEQQDSGSPSSVKLYRQILKPAGDTQEPQICSKVRLKCE